MWEAGDDVDELARAGDVRFKRGKREVEVDAPGVVVDMSDRVLDLLFKCHRHTVAMVSMVNHRHDS